MKTMKKKFKKTVKKKFKAVMHRFSSDADYLSLRKEYSGILRNLGITKAHYGSGSHLLGDGWVNIDRKASYKDATKLYMSADLASNHPFPSDHFLFSFAEDFLEHLTQDESLIFLSEAFRCLQTGGVLRLSFPGLKGVLRKHYRSSDYEGASSGKEEAFTQWGHKHFYCEESLAVVARHLGFSDVKFVQYGISVHQELRNMDYRADQRDINIYAELTK